MRFLQIVHELSYSYVESTIHDTQRGLVTRPSVFQWLNALDGDVLVWQDQKEIASKVLENYDVVHISMSGPEMGLVRKIQSILPQSSSTTVVVSPDANVEFVQAMILHVKKTYDDYVKDVKAADLAYGFDSFQARLFSYIRGENVPIIPTPVDMRAKQPYPDGYRRNLESRKDRIAVAFHKYDWQLFLPHLVSEGILPRLCLGFKGENEKFAKVQPYEDFSPHMDWVEYMLELSQCKIGFEYYTQNSMARFPIDCAVCELPLVGTTKADSARLLYPRTTFEYEDVFSLRGVLERLVTDREFYEQVANYAYEKVEEYNWENSREKFLKLLEG